MMFGGKQYTPTTMPYFNVNDTTGSPASGILLPKENAVTAGCLHLSHSEEKFYEQQHQIVDFNKIGL